SAGLGVGRECSQRVIAGESQVGYSRIAVGRRRTLDAQELTNVPPLVLIVPPVLPAVVAGLRLVDKRRTEDVGPIHPCLVEPVHAPGTIAWHARGQARRGRLAGNLRPNGHV